MHKSDSVNRICTKSHSQLGWMLHRNISNEFLFERYIILLTTTQSLKRLISAAFERLKDLWSCKYGSTTIVCSLIKKIAILHLTAILQAHSGEPAISY